MLSRSVIAFAASAFAAFASAQSSSSAASGSMSGSVTGGSTTPTSQAMPPVATEGVNVGAIDPKQRQQYCLSQRNTCPEICDGRIKTNICDENTLQYQCVCANGTIPDVTAYQGTIPYFECQSNYEQCISAHPNDLDGQTTCTNNKQCGNLTVEATKPSSTSSSDSAATSSGSGSMETMPSATGAESTASASASGSSASGAANSLLRQEVGMSVFAATVLAALKFLL